MTTYRDFDWKLFLVLIPYFCDIPVWRICLMSAIGLQLRYNISGAL